MDCTRSTEVLLDDHSTPDALDAAADNLYSLFLALTQSGGQAILPVHLPTGLALAPADAATCLKDAPRTAAFLRGLRDAILIAHRRFPHETLEIVYAGTGPFAALALPLMPRLTNVHVTLLDIHKSALASVHRLLNHFHLSATVICADATRYLHPKPIHIVLTETMQRALTVEPQVAIAANFSRQLHPRGILIPQRITVDLVVDDMRIARVADVTRRTAQRGLRRCNVLIPPHRSARYVTRITTFGRHVIEEGESGLTAPHLVHDLEPGERTFWYDTGARPGIQNSRSCR